MRPKTLFIPYLFIISLLITITVYILRGIEIFSFFPGIVMLLLMFISILLGILYLLKINRRF